MFAWVIWHNRKCTCGQYFFNTVQRGLVPRLATCVIGVMPFSWPVFSVSLPNGSVQCSAAHPVTCVAGAARWLFAGLGGGSRKCENSQPVKRKRKKEISYSQNVQNRLSLYAAITVFSLRTLLLVKISKKRFTFVELN